MYMKKKTTKIKSLNVIQLQQSQVSMAINFVKVIEKKKKKEK